MVETPGSCQSETEPLITAVIPTHRRPDLLRRAIWSVRNQDFERVRIGVYDNASGDSTEEVVRSLARDDPRIEYQRHDRNIGPIANFNFGLARVATPFFSILSDDDMLLPGFYREAAAALTARPEAYFFCGRSVVYNEVESAAYRCGADWPPGLYQPTGETVLKMIEAGYPWTGVLWRREILDFIPAVNAFGGDDAFIISAAAQRPFLVSKSDTGLLFAHTESYSGDVAGKPSLASSPEHSTFLDHLIGNTVHMQAGILALSTLDRQEKMAAIEALAANVRGHLVRWLVSKSLPAMRTREMRTIDRALATFGAPWGWRPGLHALIGVMEREGSAARVVAWAAAEMMELRAAGRRRVQLRDPLDATIKSYVAEATGQCGAHAKRE